MNEPTLAVASSRVLEAALLMTSKLRVLRNLGKVWLLVPSNETAAHYQNVALLEYSTLSLGHRLQILHWYFVV